jgi:hypothetical protein
MDSGAPSASTGGWGEAWDGDPERTDPDDYPAREPFVRLMTWAPCHSCRLRVHTLFARYLMQGIDCPGCGVSLLAPPEDALDRLAIALRDEDRLSSQIDAR